MKRIISVSRRTDIPAFYGDWLLDKLEKQRAGFINPFGGQKYLISLNPDDVIAIVFWSKNYYPFLEKLKIIDKMGYKFYFNFTITGLPNIFECNLPDTEVAINTLTKLSKLYSPKHINWRYDPIIISDKTDYKFHLINFENIALKLQNLVERCYFSYVIQNYKKVDRNLTQFQDEHNINISDPICDLQLNLANDLADIANRYGIEMFTCCGYYLIGDKIKKAHCVDGDVIEELFYKDGFKHKRKPTRKECGCTESTDIGAYNTCGHGCIYCYANINKEKAYKALKNHEYKSLFLNLSKEESDKWLESIK